MYVCIYVYIYHYITRIIQFTIIICFHTVKWFQVLLCNRNNLTSVIRLHTFKSIYI